MSQKSASFSSADLLRRFPRDRVKEKCCSLFVGRSGEEGGGGEGPRFVAEIGKGFFVCPVLPLHSLWSVRYLRFRNCGDFGLRRRRRPRLIDGPPSSSLPLHRRDRRRKREGSGKIRHRLQNSFDFRLYANLQVSSKMSMSMAYSSTSSWSNVVHRVPLSDRLQSPTQFVHCLFLSRLRGLLTREKHVLAGKSALSSFFIHAKK